MPLLSATTNKIKYSVKLQKAGYKQTTTDANSTISQPEFEAKSCNRCQTLENTRENSPSVNEPIRTRYKYM